MLSTDRPNRHCVSDADRSEHFYGSPASVCAGSSALAPLSSSTAVVPASCSKVPASRMPQQAVPATTGRCKPTKATFEQLKDERLGLRRSTASGSQDARTSSGWRSAEIRTTRCSLSRRRSATALTPRSSRPNTAGAVWSLLAFLVIVPARPSGACRRARRSSNVKRPNNQRYAAMNHEQPTPIAARFVPRRSGAPYAYRRAAPTRRRVAVCCVRPGDRRGISACRQSWDTDRSNSPCLAIHRQQLHLAAIRSAEATGAAQILRRLSTALEDDQAPSQALAME